MAGVAVLALAVLLYVKSGGSAAITALKAFSLVTLALTTATYIFEKWLWKTILGLALGCPPDYSGLWEGHVSRLKKFDANEPDKTEIEVQINQSLIEIEWHQVGRDSNGTMVAESHFIFGEVIDNHRKWSGICGMYEVTRLDKGHAKNYGSLLVDISKDGRRIEGSYCSNSGSVGSIYLEKV